MKQIEKITIDAQNYPKLLKKIPNPPKILYARGNIKSEDLFFAVVGTRRYSFYGKQIASEIAGDLAEAGLVIVSGLAPGIDTFAHQAAVDKNKKTIAVLGTGLDEESIYPKENISLAKKIIESGGCLISEYPPGTRGTIFTFPQRNRIISGLSKGVLIVEAKEKSGSLITADRAFRQKRKVFAVPGSIYSLNSQGPHGLIRKGAVLVSKANDILKELKLDNLNFLNKKERAAKTFEESLILNLLEQEPLHLDKIIEKTKLKPAQTAAIMTILEMEEKVKNLGGNVYGLNC